MPIFKLYGAMISSATLILLTTGKVDALPEMSSGENDPSKPVNQSQINMLQNEVYYLRNKLDKLQSEIVSKDDLKRVEEQQKLLLPRAEFDTSKTLLWALIVFAVLMSVLASIQGASPLLNKLSIVTSSIPSAEPSAAPSTEPSASPNVETFLSGPPN